MYTKFAAAILASVASAQMGANGYSRGIPPVTQNCNSYPLVTGAAVGATNFNFGDFNAQNIAWGLIVDREFGGCRCADEDEMEFQPDAASFKNNEWACRCLNSDLYLSKPFGTFQCIAATGATIGSRVAAKTVFAGQSADFSNVLWDTNVNTSCFNSDLVRLTDENGKKCGVTNLCRDSAVAQQRNRWDQEQGRALQTREAAKTYARKSMMPEDEIARARILRLKMTKENRMRARVQVASLSMKYRAAKNAMLAGALDKGAFEKAYKLVASTIARYRAEFARRQQDIEDSWGLTLRRQRDAERYLKNDLEKIEAIYEETLASLADRYGKRIAYFQSLPTVLNIDKDVIDFKCSQINSGCVQTNANCPIYED